MKKQLIKWDRIDDIITGKDSSFIVQNFAGIQPKIIIKNCEFEYFYSSGQVEIPFDLEFENCFFGYPFTLNTISGKKVSFLNGCKFLELLQLNLTCEEVLLDGISTNHFIGFGSSNISKVTCKAFNSTLLLYGGEYKEFHIEGTYHSINIEGGKFKKNILVTQANIKFFQIGDIEKSNHFQISKDVFIEKLSFSSKKQSHNVFIDNAHFNTFEFTNTVLMKETFFQFNKVHFNELYFDRFSNLGNIYFINIKPEEVYRLIDGVKIKDTSNRPKIIFKNSDLSRTTFIDCDLTGFNLEFQSSKISEVFLAGTEMPHSSSILSKDKKQKRLALSQIKKIYENRGDSLTANEYYAEEMKTYMSQLFGNFKFSQIPEILNLVLNRISNNFGQSWFLALTSTIIIVFLSLELFTRSLSIPISYDVLGAFQWKMGLMFEYINPTTKIKDFADSLGLKHEKLTSNSKFIFGLTRFVIIPYFVYQLIAAFRKHGKKS